MNENLNLCEILKDLEGIELYSSVYGNVILIKIINNQLCLQFHRRMAADDHVWYESNGYLYNNIPASEITLFPSKDQRDWSKFERPIPIDTPMMCSSHSCINRFRIGFYAGKIKGVHECFIDGLKHSDTDLTGCYKFIIPFDKFNPNNIEESLKYNIQNKRNNYGICNI